MPPEEAAVIDAPPPTTDAAPPTPPITDTTPPKRKAEPEPDNWLERITGKKLTPKGKAKEKDDPKAGDDEAGKGKEKGKGKESEPTGTTMPVPPKRAPRARPVPPSPAPEPPDYEKIAEASSRGFAEAMRKKDETPAPKLDAKQQRTMEVLQRLEKLHPEYAGRSNEYVESLAKLKAYKTQWQQENPGVAFDPDGDEHNDFFEKNDVDWDDQHFKDAEDALREDKIAGRITETTNVKLRQLEAKELLREAMPKVYARQAEVAKGYFAALGEDYAKVLDATGSIDRAEITRLIEADPIKEAVFQAAQGVEAFAGELHKLTLTDPTGNAIYPFNEKDAGHKFIAQFILDAEAQKKSLPPADQLDEHGRRFATGDEYGAMTPEKRKLHWRFNDRDLAEIYASFEAERVKTAIEAEEKRIERITKARGYKKADDEQSSRSTYAERLNGARPEGETPHSPAGTVEPRLAQQRKGGTGSEESSQSGWLGTIYGRK